ncbi:hypothetical protein [Paenibacillus sp. 2TAB19]|uniref:hypothetical protein n=1 Tax=Paenibacillus sp. 2TAB19 TaxID=3233003 RepID=UPI003F98A7EB
MLDYEKKFALIQKVIQNCGVDIEVIGVTDDNRFAGMHSGSLKAFVVSAYCNASYTWNSSVGSIQERGHLERMPNEYQFVDDVIGGQMELLI